MDSVAIRPVELTDAPALFAAVDASRDALRRWMSWYRDEYSLADAETWVRHARAEWEAGTGFHFAICEPAGQLVGVLGLEDVNVPSGRAMLGYWVATPAAGRGVGTGAAARALAWAREHTDVRVVWALAAEANARSRRVLEANGFRRVGERRVDERGDLELLYELDLRAGPAA